MSIPIVFKLAPSSGSDPFLVVNGKVMGRLSSKLDYAKSLKPDKVLSHYITTDKEKLAAYGLKEGSEAIVIELKQE